MFTSLFDMTSVYLLLGALALVLVLVVVRRVPSLRKSAPDWLASALLGAVFGGGVAFLSLHFFGYHWSKQPAIPDVSGGPGGGLGMPGMGMGAGMPGMGMGAGMPAMGGERNKRNLTTLVWKLELATRGITLELDDQQSAQVATRLGQLAAAPTMTDEEAQAHLAALEDLLSDQQRAALDSFGRPRPPGGGGGGMMGMGAGPPGAGSPPGDGAPEENANPFADEDQQATLRDLLARLQPAEESVEEPEEEPAEEPVEEPAVEPADESVDEPVEEPAEESVEEPADESVDEPAEE